MEGTPTKKPKLDPVCEEEDSTGRTTPVQGAAEEWNEVDTAAEFDTACCSTSTPVKGPGAATRGVEQEEELDLEVLGLDEESIEDFIEEVEGEGEGGGEEERGGEKEEWGEKLLEQVFSSVPFREMWATCRLVCRRWNQVITRTEFLSWRKRYYKLRSGQCPEEEAEAMRIMTAAHLWSISPLKPLSEFVAKEFASMRFGEGTAEALHRHPRFSCARRMVEMFSLTGQQGDKYPGVLTLLVVSCQGVGEVHSLLYTLLCPRGGLHSSLCDRTSIMELFYCLAALFLKLSERKLLPPRYHYMVYYCLTLHLEGPPTPLAGEDDVDAPVNLTSEQRAIINCLLQPGELVKVVALAGTGKTTTLLHYTLLNKHKRLLYLVYNRSVREIAENIFPCECRTFHSFALKALGKSRLYYSKKVASSFSAYNVSQLVSNPPVQRRHHDSLSKFSGVVLKTLESFFTSTDLNISEKHVPSSMFMDEPEDPELNSPVDPTYVQPAVREARQIWRRMSDPNDTKVKITHDGYVKAWQLMQPRISDYDTLLVDEAHDLTPAMMSIILAAQCSKLIVGDPHQQIYGFRGAKDAMELIHTPASRVFSLTKSFRFGPEVAYVADCLLRYLKGVKSQTLVGGLQPGSVLGERGGGQVAILARFNATLFSKMVRVASTSQRVRIGFAGGIKSYEFDMLMDIHRIMIGRPKDEIKNIFWRRFTTLTALEAYAKSVRDAPLVGKIRTCEVYGRTLPQKIELIKSMAVDRIEDADVVFSTTHKSKGLEFNTVELCDDYLQPDLLDHPEGLPVDERNLLYVAATRAKERLIMPQIMLEVLQRAGESFAYPVADPRRGNESVQVCCRCHVLFQLPKLCIQQTGITLSDGEVMAGVVCSNCAGEVLPGFQF